MDFLHSKSAFDQLMGVKKEPNQHELELFHRAKTYTQKLSWIPGIRMVAVVNSLSMYATHPDSDIDLLIVTKKNRMWIVRFLTTFIFWIFGVWRHGDDIAGNFCLSFWIEESAMDMSEIALEDDIYLSFWMYYMKPLIADSTISEEFSQANISYQFSKEREQYLSYTIKSHSQSIIFNGVLDILNRGIRFFGEKKALSSFQKKGNPEGVIIRSNMLKFHDTDRRKSIQEKFTLYESNITP